MKTHYPRYLAAAGLLAASVSLLAACGTAHSPHGGAAAQGDRAKPRHALKLLPASLTDRLVLSHVTVTAGSAIQATLVVTNNGRTTVNLTHGCRPVYSVVLTSHAYTPQVSFASDCSTRPFLIKPGVTKIPFKVMTTYLGCTQDRRQVTGHLPACLNGDRMPALTAGTYHAVLVGDGSLGLPLPTPVKVVLTHP